MKKLFVTMSVLLALVMGPMPPSYASPPDMTVHQEHVLIMNSMIRERLTDRDMLMFTYDMNDEIVDGILEYTEGDTSLVSIYETDDLTAEILEARTEHDYLIVERLVGICINDEGDGRIINTTDSAHNYLSYRFTCAHAGDIVVTYCIYNPTTDYVDDIAERFDMIVCNTNELTES